jgi:predicted NACHT family NTPase
VWDTPPEKKEYSFRRRLGERQERRVGKGHDGHEDRVYSVAFSPDGKTLATGSQDQTVRLWEIASGTSTKLNKDRLGTVHSVAFCGAACLATGTDKGQARLWVRDGAPASPEWREYELAARHAASIRRVAFSRDGKRLALGRDDKSAQVWDVANPTAATLVHDVGGHEGPVSLVAFAQESLPSPRGILITATIADRVKTGHVYKNTLELNDLLSDAEKPDRYVPRPPQPQAR